MPVEKKRKRRSRLFVKTYLYYTLLVVLVATIFVGLFLQMYQSATRRQYRVQLETQAETISKRFQEYIANNDTEGCLSYLGILIEIGDYEVWSLTNPYADQPMNAALATVDFAEVGQRNYSDLIYSAFLGRERFLTSYSEIHGCTMMSVGVPLIGRDGNVCGALLISASMEAQDYVIRSSMYMIFYSVLVAMIAALGISFLFAGHLSKPVLEMRDTALMLAAGQYEERTGINRKDEIGELAETLDFLADKLTENEKVRKNLDQMRLDFFANVSHELRTPITVMRAYTETLIDGVVTEEDKVHQYYERMLNECKSMERLVGDLLLLSKMQNPDFQIEKEPVNLVQIFDDIIRSVGAIGAAKGIHIDLKYEQPIYMMQGDYDRLRQMFLVICDNAVKFSPEGSEIHIGVNEVETGFVTVSIRDEGIGISAEELPSIFDKFYKSKLRQNAKGSGLGLAIARQIAIKHDGKIEVDSEVGKGTEFRFTFHLITDQELSELSV